MAALPKFIVEDGSCVPNANTFALPEDGEAYFPLRFGGERWDITSELKDKHCAEDKCKALFVAMDLLKCFSWRKSHCKCCENDLPKPSPNCCCDDCGNVYDKLKEAQLLIADAILNGWNPWEVSQGGILGDALITSISRPGSSMSFARPVSLSSIRGTKCATNPQTMTSQALGSRLHSLLKCYLEHKSQGITVIS